MQIFFLLSIKVNVYCVRSVSYCPFLLVSPEICMRYTLAALAAPPHRNTPVSMIHNDVREAVIVSVSVPVA